MLEHGRITIKRAAGTIRKNGRLPATLFPSTGGSRRQSSCRTITRAQFQRPPLPARLKRPAPMKAMASAVNRNMPCSSSAQPPLLVRLPIWPVGQQDGDQHVDGDDQAAQAGVDAHDEQDRRQDFADVDAIARKPGRPCEEHAGDAADAAARELEQAVQQDQDAQGQRRISLPVSSDLIMLVLFIQIEKNSGLVERTAKAHGSSVRSPFSRGRQARPLWQNPQIHQAFGRVPWEFNQRQLFQVAHAEALALMALLTGARTPAWRCGGPARRRY